MTCNFSIRARTSALPPIVSHTGSRKARFISLPFDLLMLCLSIYARSGNQNVTLGCVSIHNLGAKKCNANITIDFPAQLNAGSMPDTAPVFYGATIAQKLSRKRCNDRIAQIAWVVMPNHVHTLFVLNSAWLLEDIILSWKGFAARRINPLIGRTGGVWQRDYFDRLVRNTKHLANCVRYIRRNPQKARLHHGEFVLYESELAKGIQ